MELPFAHNSSVAIAPFCPSIPSEHITPEIRLRFAPPNAQLRLALRMSPAVMRNALNNRREKKS